MAFRCSSDSVEAVFGDYVQYLQDDHEVKERIKDRLRELDQSTRELSTQLQRIHHPGSLATIPEILKQSKTLVTGKIRINVANLVSTVPRDQYFRYHQIFNTTFQRLSFTVALINFLEKGTLINKDEVAREYLNIKVDPKDGFHLDLEDYLTGLIFLSNELTRFCVNCVTQADYQRPMKISVFLNDLMGGFRLLNLKNDSLRKKFDSLKYDLKKVEEVIYDMTIHGLIKIESKKEERSEEGQ